MKNANTESQVHVRDIPFCGFFKMRDTTRMRVIPNDESDPDTVHCVIWPSGESRYMDADTMVTPLHAELQITEQAGIAP